jgi:Domain of unknown function (DUF222)
VFAEVRSAVDALKATARGLDPACVDGHDAAALFEVVSEGERVCAAMKALLGRRVDETKVWREDGYRSAAHWVADATGETVGAACRTIETARALDELPQTTPRSAPVRSLRRKRPRSPRPRLRILQLEPTCSRQRPARV